MKKKLIASSLLALLSVAGYAQWNLNGNNIGPGNFLGSTNDVDLKFKRNGVVSGLLHFSNTSFGVYSLPQNTTGAYNTAIGPAALRDNTTGKANTALGYGALAGNMTGVQNTAVGAAAQFSNTGSFNTSVGYQTLMNNTTGQSNTATGTIALWNNTIGNENTADGNGALYSNTAGPQNTATGSFSLFTNTGGGANTAAGFNALYSNQNGNLNTSIGMSSLINSVSGGGNVAVGRMAGSANTIGNSNTYIGVAAGSGIATGSFNTIIGSAPGESATLSNTIILANGQGNPRLFINNLGNAGFGTITPQARLEVNSGLNGIGGLRFTQLNSQSPVAPANSRALGVDAAGNVIPVPSTSPGNGNWSLAGNALTATDFWGSTNDADVVFKRNGRLAGVLNAYNTSFGLGALFNRSSYPNTAIGLEALASNAAGAHNTATGAQALQSNLSGSNNTAMGEGALTSNRTGESNAAFGMNALLRNDGKFNTASGAYALRGNAKGSSNTAVGYKSGFDSNGSNSVYLGYGTGLGIAKGSNNTILGANVTGLPSDLSNTIILADGQGNQRLRIDGAGKTIIGSAGLVTPGSYKLYVEIGILTEKVKVALKKGGNWSDHVFQPRYKLTPLKAVRNYIRSNHHLPGVPSADELVKEGLDLSVMLAKQMEKIEELTLYLLEIKIKNNEVKKSRAKIDKKITALEKENTALKEALLNSQR